MSFSTKPKPGAILNPLHPINKKLVACWLFSEGGGSLVNDIARSKNHGILTNMEPNTQNSGWHCLKSVHCLSFDGTNDHINCGTNKCFDIIDLVSIVAWVKTTATSVTYKQSIATKGNDAYFLTTGEYSSSTPKATGFLRFSGGWTSLKGNTQINDGEWHQIGMTYDGSYLRVYCDGINDGTPTSASGNLLIETDPFYVGRYTSNYFEGSISNVRVYNRALSAYEIKQLYEKPFIGILPVSANIYYSTASAVGWTGTINGVTNPAEINGVAVVNISKVNGVS